MQILAYINLAVGLHPVFFLGVGHYDLCNQKGYQEHSPLSLSVYVCVRVQEEEEGALHLPKMILLRLTSVIIICILK